MILLGTTRTKCTFIHFATRRESGCLWKLRCPEWAGIEAITTAYTNVLVMQYHAVVSGVKDIDRADSGTGCI
jgi:hypothetical protein